MRTKTVTGIVFAAAALLSGCNTEFKKDATTSAGTARVATSAPSSAVKSVTTVPPKTTTATAAPSPAATTLQATTTVAATPPPTAPPTAPPTVPPTTEAPTTTTEAPTTTPAPTTTEAPTTTAAPVLAVFSGHGDDVVDIGPNNTHLIVTATHTGQRNFIADGLDSNLNELDNITNEIGKFDGTVLLTQYHKAAEVRFIKVQADGDWTFTLKDLTDIPLASATFYGHGKQVIYYTGNGGIYTVTHDGQRNFIVDFTSKDSSANLINEIGTFSGRIPVPKGPAIIVVNADGTWVFTGS